MHHLSTVAAFVMGCVAASLAQAQESTGASDDLAEIAVTGTRSAGHTEHHLADDLRIRAVL